MIESWLQVSCDGCEDSTSFDTSPNTTRSDYRAELRRTGWRSYGALDYCPRCVKLGRHKSRGSIYTPNAEVKENE